MSPAFEEGKQAALDGYNRESNPYRPDDSRALDWVDGFSVGRLYIAIGRFGNLFNTMGLQNGQ